VTRKTKEVRNNPPVPEPKPQHNYKAPVKSPVKAKTFTTREEIHTTITKTTTVIPHDVHNIERYRVSRLKAEMNDNLHKVIKNLHSEQDDLFAEEDERHKILAHLETAHKEL